MTVLSRVSVFLCSVVAWFAYASALPNHWNIVLALPCLAVGQAVCIVVHEIGHAIGAWAVRWQVVVFAVGRIAVQIPNKSLGLLKRDDNDEKAGWVLAIPLHPNLATKWRRIILIAGGPLSNLALVTILILIGYGIPHISSDPKFEPVGLLAGVVWQSLGVFLGNTLPGTVGVRGNDGARILELLRRGDASAGISPFEWILSLLNVNVRLRDLPPWMIESAAASSNEPEPHARILATVIVGRAFDALNPDHAEMRSLIDDYHVRYPLSHWSVACDAFLAAAYEGDRQRAKASLARVSGPSDVPQMTLAAEAAVSMLDGRTDNAMRQLKEMDSLVGRASTFSDLTYRDIRKAVESLKPSAYLRNAETIETHPDHA